MVLAAASLSRANTHLEQAEVLLLFITHHRDVHLGMPQVGRNFDESNRHILDSGIFHIRQDGHRHHFADRLGCF